MHSCRLWQVSTVCSFTRMRSIPLCGYVSLLTCSAAGGHSGCLQLQVILNKSVISISDRCLCPPKFSYSLGLIPRCGSFESDNKYMFYFLRNCRNIFHFHQQYIRGLAALYSSHHLFVSFIFKKNLATLIGVYWHCITVLICTSLMPSDILLYFLFIHSDFY